MARGILGGVVLLIIGIAVACVRANVNWSRAGDGGKGPPPVISGFSPTSGVFHTTLTITGQGFDAMTSVTVGDLPCAPVNLVSSTEISCPVASDPGQLEVKVTSGGGASSTFTDRFTYRSYLYVGNVTTGNISAYSIAADGVLSEISGSPFGTTTDALAIAVHPYGEAVYVLAASSNNLRRYTLNKNTGALSLTPGPITTSGNGQDINVTNNGTNIVATIANGSFVHNFGLDPDGSFSGSALNPPASTPLAARIHPTRGFYYSTHPTFVNFAIAARPIDESTGVMGIEQIYAIGGLAVASRGLCVDPLGRFIYGTGGTDTLGQFNIKPDGMLTGVGPFSTAISGYPLGCAISKNGKFLYVALNMQNKIERFSIASDGTLASLGTTPTANSPKNLVVSTGGKFLFGTATLANSVEAWKIDTDGSLSELAGSPYSAETDPTTLGVF